MSHSRIALFAYLAVLLVTEVQGMQPRWASSGMQQQRHARAMRSAANADAWPGGRSSHDTQLLHERRITQTDDQLVMQQNRDGTAAAVADAAAAGIQVVARQALFDYATQQGLQVLVQRVTGLALPDVTKTFHVPVVGDFELRLYSIRVQEFSAPHEDARLVILDKFFNLWVEQVTTHVTFDWHWEKPGLGLQGTGDGELFLRNGVINYVFSIAKSNETTRPKLEVKVADSYFESTEIKIHSFTADWLYQAVLNLFNERINGAINKGIAHALSDDVPKALNDVLASLPTHVDVKGLPFTTAFDYSIYTYSYVLFKGYGEVEASTAPSKEDSNAAVSLARKENAALLQGEVAASRRQLLHQAAARQLQGLDSQGSAAGSSQPLQQRHQGSGFQAVGSGQQQRPQQLMQQGQAEQRCPFAASELPLGRDALAADPHMVTLYLHESLLNCLAWGLYNVGALQYSVVDGAIPKLHITTDLMVMLIPALPKTYPHMPIRIDAEARSAPKVTFKPAGVTVEADYRTTIYVDNQTLGVPLVAQLDAHVVITGTLSWDSTTISSVTINHTLVQSTMDVPTRQWDTTVAWFIQNYAGLYPLQFLVNQFVKTPVTSLVALVNAQGVSLDGWFSLSGDAQLQL